VAETTRSWGCRVVVVEFRGLGVAAGRWVVCGYGVWKVAVWCRSAPPLVLSVIGRLCVFVYYLCTKKSKRDVTICICLFACMCVYHIYIYIYVCIYMYVYIFSYTYIYIYIYTYICIYIYMCVRVFVNIWNFVHISIYIL